MSTLTKKYGKQYSEEGTTMFSTNPHRDWLKLSFPISPQLNLCLYLVTESAYSHVVLHIIAAHLRLLPTTFIQFLSVKPTNSSFHLVFGLPVNCMPSMDAIYLLNLCGRENPSDEQTSGAAASKGLSYLFS